MKIIPQYLILLSCHIIIHINNNCQIKRYLIYYFFRFECFTEIKITEKLNNELVSTRVVKCHFVVFKNKNGINEIRDAQKNWK